MHNHALACALIMAALLSGCATNPITGRSQLALVPAQTIANQGNAAYEQQVQVYQSKGQILTDPAVYERVRAITDRLVAQAVLLRPDANDWNWRVNVIDDAGTVNAFCMAGGGMAVFSGLLLGLDLTDDEVAQVMAHEVSHALLDHGREGVSVGILAAVLQVAAAATGTTAFDQDLRQAGAEIATGLLMELPNSRGTETEADRVGIELAAKAGYDPQAAVSLWNKMAAHSGGGNSRFDLLNTHPATPKRIESLSAMVAGLSPVYLAARGNAPSDRNVRLANQQSSGIPNSGQSMSLQSMCDMSSPVDRAECLGQIELGMTMNEVANALGQPHERSTDGRVLRYDDRYLQLDTRNRLVGITDQRPQ